LHKHRKKTKQALGPITGQVLEKPLKDPRDSFTFGSAREAPEKPKPKIQPKKSPKL